MVIYKVLESNFPKHNMDLNRTMIFNTLYVLSCCDFVVEGGGGGGGGGGAPFEIIALNNAITMVSRKREMDRAIEALDRHTYR